MSFNDPFRNYDAWLTTDRLGEAAERAQERLDEAWSLTVEALGNVGLEVPEDALEDDHPQHPLYVLWLNFIQGVDEWHQALEAEAEQQQYEYERTHCTYCGAPHEMEPTGYSNVCERCAAGILRAEEPEP